MPENFLLEQFNEGLSHMRELFHESGRLEDSNTKLDEITKLLCLEIASAKDPNLNIPSLKEIIETDNANGNIVDLLNTALLLASKSTVLKNYDGESLLGPNPRFNIAPSESRLARELVAIIIHVFNGYIRETGNARTFEFLNEAFSHFVRDNFRQNIEDAQYMTPQEVVNFMAEMGIDALRRNNKTESPIVCDPSCGVGSFLAQFYRLWKKDVSLTTEPILVGQDKVDRMARLSLLNLSLFGISDAKVSRGNSLQQGSPLDQYIGKCDLILTNPPFGARFATTDLIENMHGFFPMMQDFIQNNNSYVDSELLFLDRYFHLLNDGGTVLAVLPDSVISSSGLPETIRNRIQQKWSIKSITELPAVTFAQAGTRTKTCILEVEKIPFKKTNVVFFGNIKDLGFEVSIKKGVPYKKNIGQNELEPLYKSIVGVKNKPLISETDYVISDSPSCVIVHQEEIKSDNWTPAQFSSQRLLALKTIEEIVNNNSDVEIFNLGDIVSIGKQSRKNFGRGNACKTISVLHIGDFGALNIRELVNFSPKTKGQPCNKGDLLFSKINPRIPRAVVVPDLPYKLECSLEFEVIHPKQGFTAHEIMLLLFSKYTQDQITALTSGTSSSHNRIKTKQLMDIKILIPKKGSALRKSYDEAVMTFTIANERLVQSSIDLFEAWTSINSIYEHLG
jgi:type I restriction-modification system DNA methylase subunit